MRKGLYISETVWPISTKFGKMMQNKTQEGTTAILKLKIVQYFIMVQNGSFWLSASLDF